MIRLVDVADKSSWVQLVSFPLRASVRVDTRDEFLDRYAQIFPQSEVAAISRADPGARARRADAVVAAPFAEDVSGGLSAKALSAATVVLRARLERRENVAATDWLRLFGEPLLRFNA